MRNALAAAENVEDKSNAFIMIKASVNGDYLCVKVENTFSKKGKKIKIGKVMDWIYCVLWLINIMDKWIPKSQMVSIVLVYQLKILN